MPITKSWFYYSTIEKYSTLIDFQKKSSSVHLRLVVHIVILALEEDETGGSQIQSLLRDLNETEFQKEKRKKQRK